MLVASGDRVPLEHSLETQMSVMSMVVKTGLFTYHALNSTRKIGKKKGSWCM